MSKIQITKKTNMKYLVNGNCNVTVIGPIVKTFSGRKGFVRTKKCNFCSPLFVKLKEKTLFIFVHAVYNKRKKCTEQFLISKLKSCECLVEKKKIQNNQKL